MVCQRYWVSVLIAITTIGLVGTVISPSTSLSLSEQQDAAEYAQHRGSGRITKVNFGNAKVDADQVEQHGIYADSHRGSGRLTGCKITPTGALAWRGSGRISA